MNPYNPRLLRINRLILEAHHHLRNYLDRDGPTHPLMTRKQILTATLIAALVGSSATAAATTEGSTQEPARTEHVIVQADFVGPSIDGELPGFFHGQPRGITYTLEPDGSSVILWASSVAGLDEGETALWVGTLTADEQAAVRNFLAESGSQATAASSGRVVCTVWADPPAFDDTYDVIEGTGYHWCSGPWARHRLIGRLQRRWGFFFWITEATADTYWEYDEDEIRTYPAFDCGSDNTRAWRNRSTGEVVAKDGRRSIRVHNSESNITEDCDV